MSDIEVIGLRTRRGNERRRFSLWSRLFRMQLFGKLPAHRSLTVAHRFQIVTYADELGDVIRYPLKIRHNRWSELYRPFFPVDMRTMTLTHEPIVAAVDPCIEIMPRHRFHRRFDHIGLQDTLLNHRKIPADKHPAVKCRNWRSKPQWLNQHLHSARRASAGDGKFDADPPHAADGRASTISQDLVVGERCSVHIRQEQFDHDKKSTM